MKKKLLILLLTVVAALCCALCFAGCGGGNNSENGENTNIQPHTHNYAYACSQTEHWQICTGCEDEKEPSPHSIENGVCPVCGYVERCTQGLEFEFYTHLNGYVVLKGTATDSDIYIPSFYNDLPVIYIGSFAGTTNLTSLTIGNGVTSIATNAFYGCTSLESVTIPDSVTSIGDYAFYECKNLISLTIPDSVTSLGSDAFYNTAYYNSEDNWVNDVLYIDNHLIQARETLSGNYDIRQGTKTISSCAFGICKNLTNINIPDSVTSIGAEAFIGCSSLESVTIGNGVTSIGEEAFIDCAGLESVTIGNSVTSIANGAFWQCTSLKSVTIPNSVTSIDHEAFYNCTSLTNVTIGNSVTSIGMGAFCDCTSLESITLPDSVISISESAFSNCTNLESITIPDSVTSIGMGAFYNTAYYNNEANWINNILYIDNHLVAAKTTLSGNYKIRQGIKTISGGAFRGCTSLTGITIPDSVISIGNLAFLDCKSLTGVYIADIQAWCNIEFELDFESEYTFMFPFTSNPLCYAHNFYLNNNLVTEITADMLQGVTEIKAYAFYDCSSLASITIPDSVTSIGRYAFYNCTSLASITIPDSVTSIGSYAFYNCTSLTNITIPDSVTSIGGWAFENCYSLTEVHITDLKAWCNIEFGSYDTNPLFYAHNLYLNNNLVTNITANMLQGVTEIKAYAFAGFGGTSIEIPNSITSIGNWAFAYCASLTSITIVNSVTHIGYEAFFNCTSLESITIPDSVTSIGDNAFDYCTSLKSVYITDLKAWCNIDFNYHYANPLYYAHNLYLNDELITEITADMLQGVTEIKAYAFFNCTSLASITIPDSVTSIGSYAFYNCTSLESITIPNSVTSIGSYAFDYCTSLTSITIPDSVTSIGNYAFVGCTNLTSVKFENTAVWKVSKYSSMQNAITVNVTDPAQNAEYLTYTYREYYWKR